MTDPFTAVGTRRVILALLLGGLLMLAYAVLQLFLVPVAWAAIMAYGSRGHGGAGSGLPFAR